MVKMVSACSSLKRLDIRTPEEGHEDQILVTLSGAKGLALEELNVARPGDGCLEFLQTQPSMKRLVLRGLTDEEQEDLGPPDSPPPSFPFRLTSLITPLNFDLPSFNSLTNH